MSSVSQNRLLSLDLLRSAAIISMVIYHFLWDLEAFGIATTISAIGPAERIWQAGTAGVFLLLVGVSFSLSRKRRGAAGTSIVRRSLMRGGIVLACAALVSLGTFVADPETYVRFGVLHLIGIGILLLPCVAALERWNIVIGAALLAVRVDSLSLPAYIGIPLGAPPLWFASVDYFPIFPWLGVILLGYGCSHWIVAAARTCDRALAPYSIPLAPVLWPGRNALLLYMIHQPLLVAAIMLTF